MSFQNLVTSYFSGEVREALIFILPLGLLSLSFGGWLLLANPSSFTKGVAIPFLGMGLMLTLVGGGVALRTPAQVAALTLTNVHDSSRAVVTSEVTRMAGVNTRWAYYLAIWAAFGAVGLALRFLIAAPFARGLGVALVFFSGVGLLVDGFAERRAHEYAVGLEQVAP